jgi:hypothetical protein
MREFGLGEEGYLVGFLVGPAAEKDGGPKDWLGFRTAANDFHAHHISIESGTGRQVLHAQPDMMDTGIPAAGLFVHRRAPLF